MKQRKSALFVAMVLLSAAVSVPHDAFAQPYDCGGGTPATGVCVSAIMATGYSGYLSNTTDGQGVYAYDTGGGVGVLGLESGNTPSVTAGVVGVYGSSAPADSGNKMGIYGASDSGDAGHFLTNYAEGNDVYGSNTNTGSTSNNVGVYGLSAGSAGSGVYGYNSSAPMQRLRETLWTASLNCASLCIRPATARAQAVVFTTELGVVQNLISLASVVPAPIHGRPDTA